MQADQDTATRQSIYHGKVIDLGKEHVTLPNGVSCELEIIRHPGGAVALAIDAQGRICLLRQYRHAAGGWLWELPGGRIEPGESALESVKRELREEAGVLAGQWAPLSSFFSTPGFCDERLHLFVARDLVQGAVATEQDEVLEVHWVALAEALARCRRGEIVDAKTIIGLYQLREYLEG